MAKKIQLQDANGNVLHPLTLGECVAMDNGENLDTLMSKSQMFTPTITQDKSMFKVGTGVDVDYSANVKDGAYESLVFKGKSLVNLLTCLRPDTHSAWVRNGSSFTLNASGVLFLNYAALLKPNTTYTVVGELDFDVDGIVIGFREGNKSWEVNRSIDSRGRFAVLISTSAESTSNALTVHRKVTSNSDRVALSNLMVLEGDWTNTELPPYFEGLGSCKMPILRNVGKNLFDLSRMNEKVFAGGGSPNIINLTDNSLTTTNNNNATSGYGYVITNLKKGVPYRLTVTNDSVSTGIANFNVSKRDGNSWHEQRIISIPIGNTASRIIYADNSTLNLSVNIMTSGANGQFTAVLKNIQIEEVSSENDLSTPYEDYKSNILRTSEEIVLREVNGVQDTYNPLTGEYVQRIGEIVLDGSENWTQNGQYSDGSYRHICNTYTDAKTSSNNVLCDKMSFVKVNSNTGEGMTSDIHVTFTTTGKVQIATTKTLSELKTWLSQNPITVQYELEAPVTTIVKPSTMTPFAYQNGHVIVESGFEGQSLLPEIEYSVVTGRTGQVTQNTKVLRKQEQQIIGLEELLLTQVVQMEYERTLLQFDYELQMMMLG